MPTPTVDDTEVVVVVVPVRAFDGAKTRLSAKLDRDGRAALARRLAGRVLAAAAPLPVLVVTADDEVATWAAGLGAEVVADPGTGLDGAAAAGRAVARRRGAHRVVVAHADLPAPDDLHRVARLDHPIVLVPDRRGDGTNVVALDLAGGPADGFHFRYGPGSFERHRTEAARCGIEPLVVLDTGLAWDVDEPEDLDGVDGP